MTVYLSNPRLFWQKLGIVLLATVVLVPLVRYKLYLPAGLYLATLLFLHLIFFYVYAARVQWSSLLKDKKQFAARCVTLILLIYLLAVITKFHGSLEIVMINLAAAWLTHALILLTLMLHFGPSDIR